MVASHLTTGHPQQSAWKNHLPCHPHWLHQFLTSFKQLCFGTESYYYKCCKNTCSCPCKCLTISFKDLIQIWRNLLYHPIPNDHTIRTKIAKSLSATQEKARTLDFEMSNTWQELDDQVSWGVFKLPYFQWLPLFKVFRMIITKER